MAAIFNGMFKAIIIAFNTTCTFKTAAKPLQTDAWLLLTA